MTALAIPELGAKVPTEFYVPSHDSLAMPLTIALIEAGVITDRHFTRRALKRIELLGEPDERELCMTVLSNWWRDANKRHGLRMFRWDLNIFRRLSGYTYADVTFNENDRAWFCLSVSEEVDIPRVTLARRVRQLEAALPGFGQTVMAVVYDTFARLPEAYTPWQAYGFGEWLEWGECETDEEQIEQYMDMNGVSREQALRDCFTRGDFFREMPRWLVRPERVRTRREILRAARDDYEKAVIAACDDIAAFVNHPSFDLGLGAVGAHATGVDSVAGIIALRWSETDEMPRLIDDGVQIAGESGEYVEFVDAAHVPLHAASIAAYIWRTEQMLHLAGLAERLISLLGDPI